MAFRSSALLVAAALLLGCGGGGGEKPGGKGGGQPAGGGSSGGAKGLETIPFPERTLKDIQGSLAADSKLTDQNVDSYIKYMKSLADLQKTAGNDPMAMAAKIQNLPKECGFKDDKDMAARMKQVAGGLHLLVVMAAVDGTHQAAGVAGLGSAELKDAYAKALVDLKKVAGEAGVSDADLRLVHRRMKDLQKMGGSE